MSESQNAPHPAAEIGIDDLGRVVLVVEGKATTFEIDSKRMRRFARDLAEAAVRKDLRG
jgi:hypothetical protein